MHKYPPGSEWFYLRVYTGHRTADRILTDILKPAWDNMNKQGLSDTWFFIRYADPDFHLRFRMKLKEASLSFEIMHGINRSLEPLFNEGLVWKTEMGTYNPEWERYGILSMAFVEQLFYRDSQAFIQALNKGSFHSDENSRWLFAMASIDHLLNDFRLLPAERKSLLLDLNRSFGKEFGKDQQLARQLSGKYRKHRDLITEILTKTSEDQLLFPLRERSSVSIETVKSILELYEADRMEVKKSRLLSDLIHMLMNRIFQKNNRLHEMVIYDLLFRYYKSQLMFRA